MTTWANGETPDLDFFNNTQGAYEDLGDISTLTTTEKATAVAGINEVNSLKSGVLHVITSTNGNTYAAYPAGLSYSLTDASNFAQSGQTDNTDFPINFGTVFTVNRSSARFFQFTHAKNTEELWQRGYSSTSGYSAWAQILTGDVTLDKLSPDYILKSDKEYYIDADSGNNSNDGLSAGNAWLTWAHALTVLPKNLGGGYTITIKFITGTTASNGYIEVRNFYNGSILLVREGDSGQWKADNIYVIGRIGCRVAYVDCVNITGTLISINFAHTVVITESELSSVASIGIYIDGCISALILNDVIATNGDGIYTERTNTTIHGCSGNNSAYGIVGRSGCIITHETGGSPTGNTADIITHFGAYFNSF